MSRRSRYETAFGAALAKQLVQHQTTQSEMAVRAGVSSTYASQVATGKRKPSPEWVELVANTLNLKGDERTKLHIAAATDNGFKLG